jgi:hypothetical protein
MKGLACNINNRTENSFRYYLKTVKFLVSTDKALKILIVVNTVRKTMTLIQFQKTKKMKNLCLKLESVIK